MVVKPVKARLSYDRTTPILLTARRPTRDKLTERLVWAGLVEVAAVLAQHIARLLIVQDQHVIEAFPAHAAQKPFACGIRFDARGRDPRRRGRPVSLPSTPCCSSA